MVLWRDPLEGWYALIALREGSWLRAMDFKLSLTPFLHRDGQQDDHRDAHEPTSIFVGKI